MKHFFRVLETSQQKINTVLEHYIQTFISKKSSLIHAMRYAALRGGKRLRPFLVYEIGQLFGMTRENLDAPAAAIECIHAYSLIHDDLPAMDNDALRRGLPTCHIKFGESTAILAGDALQTLAFSILADAEMPKVSLQDRIKIISTLATASGAKGMCLGQVLDVKDKKNSISEEELDEIYKHKTGALIRAAVRIGVLAAGKCGVPTLRYLDCFAANIGLAFQVQDDILDITHDTQMTTLRQGSNLLLGKITYPSLLGEDRARVKAQNLYHKSLASLEDVKKLGYDTTMLVALARYIIERKQ